MLPENRRALQGFFLSLTTVSMWGALPIALGIVLKKMDAYTITWYRFLSAALIVGLYLFRKNQLKPIFTVLNTRNIILIGTVIFGLGANYVLYLNALLYISAGSAQVVLQLAPAFMLLGSLLIFKERLNLLQWIGLCLVAFGLGAFFHHRFVEFFNAEGAYFIGITLGILSSLSWAAYALAQKALFKSLPSSLILFAAYAGSSLILLPTAAPLKIFHLSPFELGALVFCCLNTLVAYGAFAKAVYVWEGTRVSAVLALTPIATLTLVESLAAFFPQWVPSEQLSLISLVGAFTVVAGSMVASMAKDKASQEKLRRLEKVVDSSGH